MKYCAILFVMFCAMAATAEITGQYQEGTLVSFKMVADGASCSGGTNGKVDDNGNVNATSNSSCSNSYVGEYTVKVGENTYVLRPSLSKKSALLGFGTMGWSNLARKNSVLASHLPGTKFLIRDDSQGIHVKLGKRESKYEIVASQATS